MNSFPGDYVPTVFDNYSTNVMTKESPQRPIALNLWDTAGQEDYSSLRPLSYPMTDVFLVLYSCISRASFANVESSWLPEIRHYMPHAPIFLVATKADLKKNSELLERLNSRKQTPISIAEGEALRERQQLDGFAEVSALTQVGLHAMMDQVVLAALNPRKTNSAKKTASCSLL